MGARSGEKPICKFRVRNERSILAVWHVRENGRYGKESRRGGGSNKLRVHREEGTAAIARTGGKALIRAGVVPPRESWRNITEARPKPVAKVKTTEKATAADKATEAAKWEARRRPAPVCVSVLSPRPHKIILRCLVRVLVGFINQPGRDIGLAGAVSSRFLCDQWRYRGDGVASDPRPTMFCRIPPLQGPRSGACSERLSGKLPATGDGFLLHVNVVQAIRE